LISFYLVGGDWKIDTVTSNIDNSGTDAQVSLTVFGERGATDLIPLGAPNNGLFESGMRNEFDVSKILLQVEQN
jgi:hypothetical protein